MGIQRLVDAGLSNGFRFRGIGQITDSPMRRRATKACPGEVESGSQRRTVVRRQGHASTVESTAFPVDMGSPSDPISTENAADRRPR
jgi:hypothetical protein